MKPGCVAHAVLSFICTLAFCRTALACGAWTLEDLEYHQSAYFGAYSVTLKPSGIRGDFNLPRPAEARQFQKEPTRFVPTGMTVLDGITERRFAIDAGKIVEGTRQIGVVGSDTVEVNGQTYRLTFADAGSREWCQVEATRGTEVVARGKTMALIETCYPYTLTGGTCSDELNRQDIRNRIALYLAWQRQPRSR